MTTSTSVPADRSEWSSNDLNKLADGVVELQGIANGGSLPVAVNSYSAVADAQTLSDGAITSGLTALTSATGLFVVADVGKTVLVKGAGTAGDDLRTTIAAYVSATQVTLTAAAGGTVSGAEFSWGTDNKTAIDNALAAITPSSIGGRQVGGNTLVFNAGSYLTSGGHIWPNLVTIAGWGEQATNLIHTGNNTCFTQAGSPLISYGKHGMRGLSLWGNQGTSAIGVEFRGKQWEPYLDKDVMIGNYANGRGVLLNNLTAGDFVEGVRMDATLRYNKIGVEFRRTSGTSSFAYQRWTDFNIHVPASGTGILFGDGAISTGTCQVYSGYFNGNIWLEGNSAVAVQVGQYGLVDNNTVWFVRGEIISGTSTKALAISAGGIFYPRGIHDFAVSLAGTQATMDVASGTYRPPTRTDERLVAQGIIREPFPRAAAQGASVGTAGTEFASLVEFRRGDVVAGIALGVTVNATTLTLAKVAIWDSAGTLLASSADDSANYNAGTVPRVQKTALSAAYTIPADGAYYVGFLFVGTTGATLVRGANLAGIAIAVGTGVLPFMQSAGGKTDVGTTSVNTTGTAFWAAAY